MCPTVQILLQGVEFSWNISALSQAVADYEVEIGGARIALNVCRPPITSCNLSPTDTSSVHATPTALLLRGPYTSSAPCQALGWGALGASTAHFSLIDPVGPHEGLRVVHYGLIVPDTKSGKANGGATAPAPTDEWGQPRPPMLTVDLVCDPGAPLPAAPLEKIVLFGQQAADTSLRMRSRAGCPTKAPPLACTSAAGGSSGMPSGAHANAPSGGNVWTLVGALVGSVALLTVLLLGFAPLSLRRSLRAARASSPWPVASTAAEVDELEDGHYVSYRGQYPGAGRPGTGSYAAVAY